MAGAVGPSDVLARRVRELRRRRGWSAADLAERCKAAGMPQLTRSLIANIENRRRAAVTLEEALTLAYVLDVAPVYLFIGTDDEQPILVTPEVVAGAAYTREWVKGHFPMYDQDPEAFAAERPVVERDPEKQRRAMFQRWREAEAAGGLVVAFGSLKELSPEDATRLAHVMHPSVLAQYREWLREQEASG